MDCDSAARHEIAGHFHPSRAARLHQIGQDPVDGFFMERIEISEREVFFYAGSDMMGAVIYYRLTYASFPFS